MKVRDLLEQLNGKKKEIRDFMGMPDTIECIQGSKDHKKCKPTLNALMDMTTTFEGWFSELVKFQKQRLGKEIGVRNKRILDLVKEHEGHRQEGGKCNCHNELECLKTERNILEKEMSLWKVY